MSELSAGSSGDLTTSRRGSDSSLSLLFDDLGSGSRGEADDEMPAERTRIEANPLERINELERLAAGATASADGPTQLAPSSAVPLPPPPPGMMAAGHAGMVSGKFPDPSNLPTMIAGPDPPVLGGPPARAGFAAPGMSVPHGTPPRPQSTSSPPQIGYPVMNAEMSAQIVSGASVFPGELRGSEPHGAPPPPGAGMPGAGMQSGHDMLPGVQGGGMPGSGMPGGMHGAGMHGAGMHGAYSMPAMFDPQRAAELMSPVGHQYPEHVDWAAMAARRARAVTTWRLAALFVGAIGVALLLTVLVARLIR
jgi:hypothetical protein